MQWDFSDVALRNPGFIEDSTDAIVEMVPSLTEVAAAE
jgi:hypothetical protein